MNSQGPTHGFQVMVASFMITASEKIFLELKNGKRMSIDRFKMSEKNIE